MTARQVFAAMVRHSKTHRGGRGGVAVDVAEVRMGGRLPHRMKAKNLLCHWGARELGTTAPQWLPYE